MSSPPRKMYWDNAMTSLISLGFIIISVGFGGYCRYSVELWRALGIWNHLMDLKIHTALQLLPRYCLCSSRVIPLREKDYGWSLWCAISWLFAYLLQIRQEIHKNLDSIYLPVNIYGQGHRILLAAHLLARTEMICSASALLVRLRYAWCMAFSSWN